MRTALGRAAGRAGGAADVEVRETHISWVFLVGDHVYKLKKPIVLPFVDYGTPERRREMCRAEVRLNRGLAPDIYLGVRGLAPSARGLEIVAGDDPDAVEHLVEMRRYDEDGTLAARLGRGELTRREITELARVVAEFHRHARRVAVSGVPTLGIERRMATDVHEVLSMVERRADVDRLLSLERFAHAFVVAHAERLEARARGGCVREGHGDLRAEHVLLDAATVRIVDCVEFDRGLREADVADDLAFLVMDLEARDGGRFARMLVRAYREAGGDPGGDDLIAFYAARRALVRAKVALVRAAQHPSSSAAHGRESQAARDLIALAERFTWRARLPLAIVVCGLPASGKSHLAYALAEVSGLAHLSSDVTRKRLAGLAPSERAPSEAYSAEFSRRTYTELGRRAAEEVGARGGSLIDATFRHRRDRDVFAGAFAAAAPLLFIECQAPATVRAARAERARPRPDAGLGCDPLGRPARERRLGAARRGRGRRAPDPSHRPPRAMRSSPTSPGCWTIASVDRRSRRPSRADGRAGGRIPRASTPLRDTG